MSIPIYSPEIALALEKDMLESVTIREADFQFSIWQTTQCLVAPKSLGRNVNFEAAQTSLQEQSWPIFLRDTGGDITPQGQGILNVSLAYLAPKNKLSIKQVYIDFCTPILSLLKDFELDAYCSSVPNSFCDGAFNIVIGGKKLAGTAQRWKQIKDKSGQVHKAIFIHALILINTDIEASCSTINQLYQICDIESSVNADVHINLESIIDQQINMNTLAKSLKQKYFQAYEKIV